MNKWIKKDLQYIWHPYTQMKDCRRIPPILILKAKGLKLYDDQGKVYYDTISSWWCNVHGHNHPKIKKAINKQLSSLDHVLFAGFTHTPAIKLAQKLIEITPKKLTKAFFSDNGSTAVEVALKMSFQYWQNVGQSQKRKFICLDRGYHGDTVGAMSVSGLGLFNQVFEPLFFPSLKIPSPYCYRCPMRKIRTSCHLECIRPLEKLLQRKKLRIAALIIEPLVLAAGGMIIYPKEYLRSVVDLCKKYNVHLIFDEVAVGFGRTGKMFAAEHIKAEADFICLSKGITSGTLPLGVTLTSNKVYQAFCADYGKKKTFYHGHTYTANPISCAAALASLEIFKQEKTLNKVNKLIPLFYNEMDKFRQLSLVGDVRYLGFIAAIELVKDKNTKQPLSFKERVMLEIYRQGLKEGIILRPLGNIIYFYLPLCTRRQQLIQILNKTFKIIKKFSKMT